MQVNPHVTTILDAQAAQGMRAPLLPRTDSQGPACTAGTLAGVSAFAFQGTNAHTILATMPEGQVSGTEATLKLQRSRHWFTDWRPHALVQRAVAMPGCGLHVQAQLGRPELAFLCDHQVGLSCINSNSRQTYRHITAQPVAALCPHSACMRMYCRSSVTTVTNAGLSMQQACIGRFMPHVAHFPVHA